MQLKINSLNEQAIQVQIDGEDYSVCDIIHKELLALKHVKFAGVAPPHPLIKTMAIQFHTDGADGSKLLAEAVDNAKKKVDELFTIAQQSFPLPVQKIAPASREIESKSAPVGTEIIEPSPSVPQGEESLKSDIPSASAA